MISRAELDALFAEDDRRRAKHREFMAQRETLASPPVSETASTGIVYKDLDNGALRSAHPGAEEPSYWFEWQEWFETTFEPHRKALLGGIADAMTKLLRQERDAIDRKIAALEGELIETKALLAEAVRAENLSPDVLVMQPADHGVRHDTSDLLNRARDRRILVQ